MVFYDAIKRTEAEGFPRGAVIYLDVEYMRAVPQKMRDYYRAWTQALPWLPCWPNFAAETD